MVLSLIRLLAICRAPHGARGLKYNACQDVYKSYSRAPHGARGLKSFPWRSASHALTRRAPHGARGLKYVTVIRSINAASRAPHGARGLKYRALTTMYAMAIVAPRMGRVD